MTNKYKQKEAYKKWYFRPKKRLKNKIFNLGAFGRCKYLVKLEERE